MARARVCRLVRSRLAHRLQSEQIVDRARGERGGGEDRLGVAFENLEPVAAILSMIGSRRIRDFELGTEERGADLGDQLEKRIGVRAEPGAGVEAEAMGRVTPVKLMPISA